MRDPAQRRVLTATVAVTALLLPLGGSALAHDDRVSADGGARYGAADVYTRHALSGHADSEPADAGPAATSVGFEHVSTFTFDFDGDGQLDTGVGSVTDVWEHEGTAYVGTFYEPDCSRFGTRIVDLGDPSSPEYLGNLPSMPNTRVNDVKVTSVDNAWFTGDLLAATQEPCFISRGDGGSMENKGGVVLYDVTEPGNPELIKRAYVAGTSGSETNFGVHNTFFWEDDGRTLLGVVDDDNVRDLHIVDVSNPERPTELSAVGWPDWFGAGGPAEGTDPQGASGLGSFAATALHDVWVEFHDHDGDGEAEPIGYLSYWDAGLVLLDLSDPADPVFLGDSDYDTTGPEGDAVGEEGNSHVAVPAPVEDGRYVLMGDEDFSPFRSSVTYNPPSGDPVEIAAAEGAFTTPLSSLPEDTLPAELVSAGGTLCSGNDVDFRGEVALISRGACTFQLKAENAQAQGASGMVVYNNAGEGLVLMGGDGIDGFFGFFVGQSDGIAMEDAVAAGTTTFDASNVFDGWGYLRVIDTRPDADEAPGNKGGTKKGGASTAAPTSEFVEVGSFATPNTFRNPPLAGDYTMHNIVMGPAGTDWADTAFVSWYSDGMLALDASDPTQLAWTGQWVGCHGQGGCDPTLDSNGKAQAAATNFWGVYSTVINGDVYVLGSDRNNGLVVLRPVAGGSVPGPLAPGGGATP